MDEQQQTESPDASPHPITAFPVVGIGASAGGLPALTRLLEHLPPAPDMALVVVMHLAPDAPSVADRLLQRATRMPVLQVRGRMRLAPNRVHVIAPGHGLRMEDGWLIADAPSATAGIPMAINSFLRNLADAHGEHAIGVILSGMGSDGTAGLAHIKAHGGMTIAQLPEEAEEKGMPQGAIASGAVDFVLPAAEVAARLMEARDAMQAGRQNATPGAAPAGPAAAGADTHAATNVDTDAMLHAILSLLRTSSGHDFGHYRQATVLRRIERRMQVRARPDLAAYLDLLRQDRPELDVLLQEMLIGVTGFFRDHDAFAALEHTVLPQLLRDRAPGQPLRAWVAACASGEEAYSLGMLLAEQAGPDVEEGAIQVFATDIDDRAIAVARAGRYPEAIAADLAPERLARFFVHEEDRFKVRKPLRDTILFARHDLLRDPAFLHLDLVSCRNVLAYMNRDLHRRVLELFHDALNPGGYLFLGSAESADGASDLFAAVDSRHGLYQAKPPAQGMRRAPPLPLSMPGARYLPEVRTAGALAPEVRKPSLTDLHARALARLAPPSLLVNAAGEIVHASEHAAAFVGYGGEPSTQVLALVLPALRASLRSAMFQAQKSGKPVHTGPIRRHPAGGPERLGPVCRPRTFGRQRLRPSPYQAGGAGQPAQDPVGVMSAGSGARGPAVPAAGRA